MGVTPRKSPKRPWISEYTWLHLATGDPDSQLRLLREARAKGLRVSVDPGQEVRYRWDPRRLRTLVSGAELLFGNRWEVARVAAAFGASTPEELLAYVPLIVRTEGTRGSTAFSRAGTVHVPSARARSVRTVVGAGDSFRGGFYAAWFEGEELRKCLVTGARAAARWMEGGR